MRRVHSSMIFSALRFGIPGEASEAVEIGHGERAAEPVCIHADVGDADEAAGGTMEHSARDQIFHWRWPSTRSTRMSKSSTSFHMGTRKQSWRCCPVYSCVICSSMASLVRRRPAKSGEAGSRT